VQVEAPLVGPGEREQAVHEIRHARRLLQRLLERLHRLAARRSGCIARSTSAPQHGERRLELVRRVGGEAAERAERRLEARDHRVQRVPSRDSSSLPRSAEAAGAATGRR
jgi:hypothetical protein